MSGQSIAVYVPRDSSALSLGAEEVADAIAREAASRGVELHFVRNGSRGLYWLEPMVEVATPRGPGRLWARHSRRRSIALQCRVCSGGDHRLRSASPMRFPT